MATRNSTTSAPCYLSLTGDQWRKKIAEADRRAIVCALCPRQCGVNRIAGERGFCRAGNRIVLASAFPHHGEEPPVSGTHGSGTIFFSGCTLQCCFCQNYQISHQKTGREYSIESCAEEMLNLQRRGCHNINLVTPTHFLPWILRALYTARNSGLRLPIVYNCGGYERPETLRLLDGIVDIYLPDMKYGSSLSSWKYSHARDYVSVNRHAITEMYSQAGPLVTDSEGIARRGTIIRHLILPDNLAGSQQVVNVVRLHFPPESLTVSIMAQYRPMFRAYRYKRLNRTITPEEYRRACDLFIDAGFGGYYQELDSMDSNYCIDFTTRKDERLGEIDRETGRNSPADRER
jgi:putative pyruvate formate lyase activating enzyme